MSTKQLLGDWICEALNDYGGEAQLVDVAKHIWQHHASELQRLGDLFYTWQYDMRWVALQLRKQHRLKAVDGGTKGKWELQRN